MSSDTLRQQIHRTPFHPITLMLPSGNAITIDNPEFAMFNETGRTLAVWQGEHLFFIDVAAVKAMKTAAD